MRTFYDILKQVFPGPPIDKKFDGTKASPFCPEYIMALLFLLVIGFVGTQIIIKVLSNPSSKISFYSINESACNSGLRLSFLQCEVEIITKPITKTPEIKNESGPKRLIKDMLLADDSPSLRQQFASLPNLTAALNKLQWNDGDEQEAVRLLTLFKTLTNGRQREAHLVQSAGTGLFGKVWNSYPDLVAASHCMYCGSFYYNVLQPFIAEGSENREHLEALAKGHPQFLKALYDSGQLELSKINNIAKIQAELSGAGDAGTAKFIGDILIKDNDIELLRNWSSRGGNGTYSFSHHKSLQSLPKDLIIFAWERTVSKGYDNGTLTRYLISKGYRPALRWLLWIQSGDLSYFKRLKEQHERDGYNGFLTQKNFDFPKESYNDLSAFYSNNWKNISWNETTEKWVYQSSQ